jgi:hypothetical protein
MPSDHVHLTVLVLVLPVPLPVIAIIVVILTRCGVGVEVHGVRVTSARDLLTFLLSQIRVFKLVAHLLRVILPTITPTRPILPLPRVLQLIFAIFVVVFVVVFIVIIIFVIFIVVIIIVVIFIVIIAFGSFLITVAFSVHYPCCCTLALLALLGLSLVCLLFRLLLLRYSLRIFDPFSIAHCGRFVFHDFQSLRNLGPVC